MATKARPLRRDAQRNRDLLVATASRVFAARGLDVPLEDIARAAGVSIGTLYNRFPTRGELVDAALAAKAAAAVGIAKRAVAMADAWAGFTWFLEHTCELQAGDRGYNELCAKSVQNTPEIDALTVRGYELLLSIIDRAQVAGALRADFRQGDLAFVIWSITRTIQATGKHTPGAWRRHLALMLDGLRAGAAHPLPHRALRPDEVTEAMRSLAD